jgi:hypothetical protein
VEYCKLKDIGNSSRNMEREEAIDFTVNLVNTTSSLLLSSTAWVEVHSKGDRYRGASTIFRFQNDIKFIVPFLFLKSKKTYIMFNSCHS